MPPVVAYHSIISAYGFWLPNDPRGSWSDFVGSWDLLLAGGKATRIQTDRSVAAAPHDRTARLAVKRRLKAPPVKFTGIQARTIGHGMAGVIMARQYAVRACAILPDHLHLVIARYARRIESIISELKFAATRQLYAEGLHPFQDWDGRRRISAWAVGSWNVFLGTDDISRAVHYVENNPIKQGLSRQRWSFVTPIS